MALLAEYALTPDVFDGTSYSSTEICGVHLQTLKDVLLQEGLVRNLWNGEWAKTIIGNERPWHPRGKELLKKLVIQNRLTSFPAIRPSFPDNDAFWCEEALASHGVIPLNGIIVTECISGSFNNQPLVAPVQKLPTTTWWSNRSPSLRLLRNLTDYRAALNLVLKNANSILFIDPHLDPCRLQYRDFGKLLEVAGSRTPPPMIEVHRVCYRGSGSQRQILNLTEIEGWFRNNLFGTLRQVGLKMEVFVWDDFHDRYLISDLVGISLANGFDTTTSPNAKTTWTRLGRADRDDIQREFDPASNRHVLRGKLLIS